MQFNQKLIKDLKDGRVILYNEPKNPETALEIIVATGTSITWFDGQSTYYYKETSWMMYGYDRLDLLPKLPIVPIADFLLPEHTFKTCDWVRCKSTGREGKITAGEYDEKTGIVYYSIVGIGWADSRISQNDIEPATEFIIGQEYEFSDRIERGWVQGRLLAIIDDEYKYVARLHDNESPASWQQIRPIQPKVIERWINMSQSGNQVGKKCFESEMEARQHAPQSQNVFQVKLTGTYTI